METEPQAFSAAFQLPGCSRGFDPSRMLQAEPGGNETRINRTGPVIVRWLPYAIATVGRGVDHTFNFAHRMGRSISAQATVTQ